MNRQEAAKLLALVQLAYPAAYRDLDDVGRKATVNMWQSSFHEVPYPVMEQAFNRFRMESKFPPTVAEMVLELRKIHFHAENCALIHRDLDNPEMVTKFQNLADCTRRFREPPQVGDLWGKGGFSHEALHGYSGEMPLLQVRGSAEDLLRGGPAGDGHPSDL